MPATVVIRSLHGATGATATTVSGTGARFKLADNDTIDNLTPVTIPNAGTVRSYVKQFEWYASTTPANTITNLRLYSDGSNGLGTGVDFAVRTLPTLTGTADSGSTTALTDTGAFTGRDLTGFVCEITGGSQSGEFVRIGSNTNDTLTFATTLPGAITNTSTYRIAYLDPLNWTTTALSGTASFFTYTSGSPLSVPGSLSNPSTGRIGDLVQMQMTVTSTASLGPTPTETATFVYDES